MGKKKTINWRGEIYITQEIIASDKAWAPVQKYSDWKRKNSFGKGFQKRKSSNQSLLKGERKQVFSNTVEYPLSKPEGK